MKKTREVLITDPNSKAHSHGKLKKAVLREPVSPVSWLATMAWLWIRLGRKWEPDRVIIGSGGASSPSWQEMGPLIGGGGGASRGSIRNRKENTAVLSWAWAAGSGGSGAMDGLLEAAASLSDGEPLERPRATKATS